MKIREKKSNVSQKITRERERGGGGWTGRKIKRTIDKERKK